MLRAASVLLLFGPLFPPHRPLSPLGGALALLAAALAIGALTRLAAGLCAVAITVVGAQLGDPQTSMAGAGAGAAMSLGLALLGPGAYSVDARLFGRRIVDLSP